MPCQGTKCWCEPELPTPFLMFRIDQGVRFVDYRHKVLLIGRTLLKRDSPVSKQLHVLLPCRGVSRKLLAVFLAQASQCMRGNRDVTCSSFDHTSRRTCAASNLEQL